MILKGPWSYSRATSCARSLYLEKVLKASPEPRSERFLEIDRRALGSIKHECADEIIKAIHKKKSLNIHDLVEKLLNSTVDGTKPFFHLRPLAQEIEESMEMFVDRFRCDHDMTKQERDAVIRDNSLGNEMKIAVTADDEVSAYTKCPEDGLRGIVDYAEVDGDTLIIIDFKNRPAIFPVAELRKDEQLSCYLHLVNCYSGGKFKKFKVGIYYFEFGYTQVIELEKEEYERNVERLRSRARAKEAMKKEDIGPEPGFGKCQYCDYLASCDAGQEFMAGGELVSMDLDQAKQLASWVMVHDEKLKTAKKALNLFTSEHGPITLDDKTIVGHSLSLDGVEYDKNKTLRILKMLLNEGVINGKLSEYTSLNTTEVKKLAKREDVRTALEPATSPKARPKFEFFKPTNKRGVRTVKEGRKTVVHPEDRKTGARVKRGVK